MSYGMMVAVQLDHQTEFDRIWSWVKNRRDPMVVQDLGLGVRRRWSA